MHLLSSVKSTSISKIILPLAMVITTFYVMHAHGCLKCLKSYDAIFHIIYDIN